LEAYGGVGDRRHLFLGGGLRLVGFYEAADDLAESLALLAETFELLIDVLVNNHPLPFTSDMTSSAA
jgi:hypothetical protein